MTTAADPAAATAERATDAVAGWAPRARTFAPVLLVLFAGSGCAALVYEVVWFHLLRFVVGGSSSSLGFLLGSFMGGMCLGSLLLPRLLGSRLHPLRVWALLELGIAACGVLLPQVLPALGSLYVQGLGHGRVDLLLRGTVCAVALLPPTMLMGATLPVMARHVGSSRAGVGALGRFYASNILGGVAGTLLAGFWLLRLHDTWFASQCAAGLNVGIALFALVLARRPSAPPMDEHAVGERAPEPAAAPVPAAAVAPRARLVWLAIGLSGATALAAEVVWTRLLGLLFGASVYSFALILAVFLIGLGIGSARGSRLALRPATQPWRAFARCQALLPLAILWSAFAIGYLIPWAEPTWIFKDFVSQNPWVRFPWDFARCTFAILPAPILWGASFPLALAAAAAHSEQRDAGRLVGGISAANTLGAILGALLASLVAIGSFGSQRTQQGLVAVAGLTALLPLFGSDPLPRRRKALAGVLFAAVAAGCAFLLPPVPNGLIAWGRFVDSWDGSDYRYVAEGHDSSVAVTMTDALLNFHVAGKVEASTDQTDMRLQRLLGHLPALAHGAPRDVLIVGCGAGVTAGCFCDYGSVHRIVICELEPRVLDCARGFMSEANGGVLDDRRTEIVFDDARHFLLTTRERFDLITSDPIHPWVRGAAALYTREYFELVKQHLNPGGVVTQWVPLYETDRASVQSQLATFFDAFPDGTIWNSGIGATGYDLAVLGSLEPLRFDLDAVEARLDGDLLARMHLDAVALGSAARLFATYSGRGRDLQAWLAGAQRNDDVALRLQYLAGLALDRHDEQQIFDSMQPMRRWPDDLFSGTPELLAELRQLWQK